ncbi:MAG: RpiB/LacA/LacB family sugar-phosphate isomerase [Patescibacteria group bacterium]
MKIFIEADHVGFEIKEKLMDYLINQGYEVADKGAFVFNKDDDYPDFVRPVAEAVVSEEGSMGIIIGGSGFGEAICANRVRGSRALVFYGPMLPEIAVDVEGRESDDPYEIIKLARLHNDANIISFGVRFITEEQMKEAVKVFLETKFSGDERHVRRIKKLDL